MFILKKLEAQKEEITDNVAVKSDVPQAELDKFGRRGNRKPEEIITVIINYYNNEKSLVGLANYDNTAYVWLSYIINKKTDNQEIIKQLLAAGISKVELDKIGTRKKRNQQECITDIIEFYNKHKTLSKLSRDPRTYLWLFTNKDNQEIKNQLLAAGIPQTELDKVGDKTKKKKREKEEIITAIAKYFHNKKSLGGLVSYDNAAYVWLYKVLCDPKKTKVKPEIMELLLAAGIPIEELDKIGSGK